MGQHSVKIPYGVYSLSSETVVAIFYSEYHRYVSFCILGKFHSDYNRSVLRQYSEPSYVATF